MRADPRASYRFAWKRIRWRGLFKWLATYFLLGSLIFLASWQRFPNFLYGCVDYLEWKFFALADYSTSRRIDPRLRLIRIDEKEKGDPWYFGDEVARREFRKHHAKLVTALGMAGAKIVAFDFTFADSSPYDTSLAEAVRNARETLVIVGSEPMPDRTNSSVSPVLASVIGPRQLGSIRVGGKRQDYANVYYRHILLAESRSHTMAKEEPQPSFPLRIKLAWEELERGKQVVLSIDEIESRINLDSGGERIESIPCRIQREKELGATRLAASMVLQMADEADLAAISHPYDKVQKWIEEGSTNLERIYHGSIVIVGLHTKEDLVIPASNGGIHGYEMHASTVSSLLNSIYPRELGNWGHLAVLFFLSLGAGISRVAFPRGLRPFGVRLLGREWSVPQTLLVLLVTYVILAVVLYSRARIYLDVAYHAMALVAGYFAAGWFLLESSGAKETAMTTQPETKNTKEKDAAAG